LHGIGGGQHALHPPPPEPPNKKALQERVVQSVNNKISCLSIEEDLKLTINFIGKQSLKVGVDFARIKGREIKPAYLSN
jgi:hypothetical protein